jgi:neutral ceramidase
MQHYEGGHNQFGPWTLRAFQQEFSKLSEALITGIPVDPGPEPRDIGYLQKTLHVGVVWDGKLLWEKFGQIFNEDENENYDAEPFYSSGETVRVSFVGGHPNNNLQRVKTFLKVKKVEEAVERCTTTGWWIFRTTRCTTVPGSETVIATDNDPSTKYIWKRHHTDRSRIDIEWEIPHGTPSGTYRISHYGYWKDGNPFSSTFQQCVPYEGDSSLFFVEGT